MEQYCMYLRKSRADRDLEIQGVGETLARHETTLNTLASTLKLNVTAAYKEVVSGDTIAGRPMMQRLLSEVEQGLWAGVLVMEVERLARGNSIDQGIVSQAFKFSGTKIITPTKTYDPSNEFDEEYFEFGLFMSRREYKTINRRLQRGRIASVKEGKFVGSAAPYGYIKIKIPHEKGYTLEIDEEKAEVVRMIYNWYCYGELQEDNTYHKMGADVIATRLDILGIKPPVKDKWSKSTIQDILSNPTYAGKIRFGFDAESKTMENGTISNKRKRNQNCLVTKGIHPAIITEELFNKVALIRAANVKNTVPGNLTLQNPLSGIVYCKKCGALMTRLGPNSKNKYSVLKCPNKYCDNVSAPLFLIERELLNFLSSWLNDYKISADLQNDTPFDDEINIRRKALISLDKDLSTYKTQLNNTYSFFEQGIYSLELFQQREEVIKKSIVELNEQRKILLDDLKRYENLKLSKEEYAPKVEKLLDTYADNTPAINNDILKELIEKIEYIKKDRNRKGTLENKNFSLSIFPRVPS